MKNRCEWCEGTNILDTSASVYWELPDGSRAIEIEETPTCFCPDCKMTYQREELIKEIENQLFLIDCKKIGKNIVYHELMNLPRLLKRNYFDFSS